MRLGKSFVSYEKKFAQKAGQFFLGHNQPKGLSDNSASKLGEAFNKLGLHQVTFPHLVLNGHNNISSGSKFIGNTNNSENAGILRRLTRFRGQASRARFMKTAIKKLDNDRLLIEIAKILTRKRSFDDRSQNHHSYRLLEPENYMPVLKQAIKFNKPEILNIFIQNRRSFTQKEETQLRTLIAARPDSNQLKTVFEGYFPKSS